MTETDGIEDKDLGDLGGAVQPHSFEEPDFPDLPILAPAPLPVADVAVLGDILADSLFGDVIEMSELIPHLFEGQAGAADGGVFQEFAAVPEPVADASAAVLPFNIFFDEDGSSGHGTI